jgi:hypothetical protein
MDIDLHPIGCHLVLQDTDDQVAIRDCVFTLSVSFERAADLWEAVCEFAPVCMSANLTPIFNPLKTMFLDHLSNMPGIVHHLKAFRGR